MPTQTKKTRTQTTPKGVFKRLDDLNLRDRIEKRAHEIWLSSGRVHGDDVAHWLQAENEVLVERQKEPK